MCVCHARPENFAAKTMTETSTTIGAILCAIVCCVCPAIHFFVCGYSVNESGAKLRNVPCSFAVGTIQQCICCLALSLLAGIIKL